MRTQAQTSNLAMPSFLKAMAACVADRSADQDTVGEARFPTITLEDAIDQREWLSKTLIDFNWTNIIDDQSTRICEPSLSHCDTRYVACMTYNMLEYILLDVTSFLDFLMKESYIYIILWHWHFMIFSCRPSAGLVGTFAPSTAATCPAFAARRTVQSSAQWCCDIAEDRTCGHMPTMWRTQIQRKTLADQTTCDISVKVFSLYFAVEADPKSDPKSLCNVCHHFCSSTRSPDGPQLSAGTLQLWWGSCSLRLSQNPTAFANRIQQPQLEMTRIAIWVWFFQTSWHDLTCFILTVLRVPTLQSFQRGHVRAIESIQKSGLGRW